MLIIPTFSDPSYTQVTNFDGVDYVLVFRWSDRESVWRLDISDTEANDLATSIPLHVGTDLLLGPRRYGTGLPTGLLMVYDTSGYNVDPNIDELGDGLRCTLVYFAADEILADVAAAS